MSHKKWDRRGAKGGQAHPPHLNGCAEPRDGLHGGGARIATKQGKAQSIPLGNEKVRHNLQKTPGREL